MSHPLREASLELLEHLHTHGPCTAEELHAATCAGRPHQYERDIARRLERLESLHWIYSEIGADGLTRWAALGGAPEPARPARPKPYVGQVVPPRRIDVMHTTWEPPAGMALRPGALDYQRCASRGLRC
jgi:hypothetical protein